MKKNLPGKDDKPLTERGKKKLEMDWDQRPDNICPNCGYHRKSCVCSVQKPRVVENLGLEASIDFYQ